MFYENISMKSEGGEVSLRKMSVSLQYFLGLTWCCLMCVRGKKVMAAFLFFIFPNWSANFGLWGQIIFLGLSFHVLLSSLFNVSSTSSQEAIQVVEGPHILRPIINAMALESRMKKRSKGQFQIWRMTWEQLLYSNFNMIWEQLLALSMSSIIHKSIWD